ncbi:unnamed protein product [Oikopleura dioica]|uniref:Uncharacterized protein n=1 Tax=Oikopleura dioica TaxID=34765 RepID=E4XEX7_OIKDI|nr:unnamed protein product [Oikopleura dioica]
MKKNYNKEIAMMLRFLHRENGIKDLEGNSWNEKKVFLFRYRSYKKIDLDEALKGSVFYITATSTDTKNKLNILIFVWFDSVGKKEFFNSNRETIEFVGEYPSRYMWYVYEFYEEYRNEPFETIDIDRFPHLYILRDKKKKNRDKK